MCYLIFKTCHLIAVKECNTAHLSVMFKGSDSAWCPPSLRLWGQLNVKRNFRQYNLPLVWYWARGPQPQAKSILLRDNQKKNHIIPQQCSSKNIPEKQLAIQNELPTSTSTQAIAAYCNLTQFSAFKSILLCKIFLIM